LQLKAFRRYDQLVPIEFDPAKSAENVERRGLPFDMVEAFEWDPALIEPDDRRDDGEALAKAIGFIAGVLYSVVFTLQPEALRVISLRRASRKERMLWRTDRNRT